jgi:hypothetical protein
MGCKGGFIDGVVFRLYDDVSNKTISFRQVKQNTSYEAESAGPNLAPRRH